MRNAEVATIFDELADRLLLQGESWFKVRAYREGAAAILAAAEPVETLSLAGRLGELPGVGKAMIEKTASYLATGSFPLLDRARAATPAALLALLHAGLQPAAVRGLHTRFGVDDLAALRTALNDGTLDAEPKLRAAVAAVFEGARA
ncbi:MAG: hypothetical protein ACYDCQ_20330 [Dehalococcoidia bacterium]